MNIQKLYQDDHQMKLTVEVDAQTVSNARQKAARNLSKQTKIPGFRPGKAPYSVILRTIGETAIFEEAVDIIARELYPQAIDEAKIEPYGPGQLLNIESMDPLVLEFLVPLDAEVTLGDYHSIRIPYATPQITEADVEKVLSGLREQHAVLNPVERPAEEGDQVTVKLSARRKDVAENENPILIEERSSSIIIKKSGDEANKEWPFQGFSQHLIGLSTGNNKTIPYTYPEDAEWEALRNREAIFELQVEAIKSRQVPELNDDFAQTIGEYPTMEDLRKEIQTSLEEQSTNEYKSDYHQQIVSGLVQDATIKYPPQMLDHEIHLYIDQLGSRLAQQGLDLETYLKTRQMTEEALHEEIKPLAEQRLKQTLVIFKIARTENITVSNEEIEAESAQVLAQISKYMTPDQARKAISEGSIRDMVGNISTDLLVRHTYARLEAIANGTYTAEEPAIEAPVTEEPEFVESPLTSTEPSAPIIVEKPVD